jgi:hypothetical protein
MSANGIDDIKIDFSADALSLANSGQWDVAVNQAKNEFSFSQNQFSLPMSDSPVFSLGNTDFGFDKAKSSDNSLFAPFDLNNSNFAGFSSVSQVPNFDLGTGSFKAYDFATLPSPSPVALDALKTAPGLTYNQGNILELGLDLGQSSKPGAPVLSSATPKPLTASDAPEGSALHDAVTKGQVWTANDATRKADSSADSIFAYVPGLSPVSTDTLRIDGKVSSIDKTSDFVQNKVIGLNSNPKSTPNTIVPDLVDSGTLRSADDAFSFFNANISANSSSGNGLTDQYLIAQKIGDVVSPYENPVDMTSKKPLAKGEVMATMINEQNQLTAEVKFLGRNADGTVNLLYTNKNGSFEYRGLPEFPKDRLGATSMASALNLTDWFETTGLKYATPVSTPTSLPGANSGAPIPADAQRLSPGTTPNGAAPSTKPIDYSVVLPAKLKDQSGGTVKVETSNPLTTGNNPNTTLIPKGKVEGLGTADQVAIGYVQGASEPFLAGSNWLRDRNIPFVSDVAGNFSAALDADLSNYVAQGYDPEAGPSQIGRGIGTAATVLAGGEALGIGKGVGWAASKIPFVRTAAIGAGNVMANPVVQKTGQIATGVVVGNNIADGDYRSAIINGSAGTAIFRTQTPTLTQNPATPEFKPDPTKIAEAPTPVTRKMVDVPDLSNQSRLATGTGRSGSQQTGNFNQLGQTETPFAIETTTPAGTPTLVQTGSGIQVPIVSSNGAPLVVNPQIKAPLNTPAGSIPKTVMNPQTGEFSTVQVPVTVTTPQLPSPGQVVTPLTGKELKEAALSKVGDTLFGQYGTKVGDTTYAGFSDNYKIEGLFAGVDKNFAQMQRGAKVLQDGVNETAGEIFSPISTSWSKNASENQKIVTTMISKDYKDTSKILSNTLDVIKSPEFGYVTDAAKYTAAGNIGGQILNGDAKWYFNTPRTDVKKIDEAGDLANAAKKANFSGFILNANDSGNVPGYAGVFGYNGNIEDTAPKQGFVRIFSGNKPSTIGLNTIQQTVLSPVDWNMGALFGNEHLNIRGSAGLRLGPAWVPPNTIRTADGKPGVKGAATIGGAVSVIAPAVTVPVPNLQDGKLNWDNSLMFGVRQVEPFAAGGYLSTFANPFDIQIPDGAAKSSSIWVAPHIHKENPLQEYVPINTQFVGDIKLDESLLKPSTEKITIAPLPASLENPNDGTYKPFGK